VPRFDHDASSLVCKGLLIEESRTNLLNYSEDFSNAYWITSATISSNNAVSPDGTTSADTITYTAAAAQTYGTATVSPSTLYTFSYYVKLGTKTSNNFAIYDATNLAFIVGSTASTGPSTSTWTRITITFTTPAGCTSVRCYPDSNDVAVAGTIYVWGAQLETGNFATSYIPTTTTTVTRGLDLCYIPQANMSWFNSTEGSFEVSGYKNYQPSSFPWLFAIKPLANNTETVGVFYNAATGVIAPLVRVGGVVQYNPNTSAFSINTIHNVSLTYKANDFNFCFDGGTLYPDTTGSIPVIEALYLGYGDNPWNGHISKITYYPKRLTDTQLQNLSN
jgi:hypothetical protein